MFFVFDGVDGAGKSTQLERFAKWLSDNGREIVVCKDPGSTPLGEQLRDLLLNSKDLPIHMRTEMMLFTTARTQLVEQIVRPAIAAGKVVVLDRYLFSTVVYQGYAGKLDPKMIWDLNQVATDGVMPNATFLLDIPVEIAMQRLGDNLDRMESRGPDYFEKVRAGFLTIAKHHESVHVIDANRDIDAIESSIRQIARTVLKLNDASEGSGVSQ